MGCDIHGYIEVRKYDMWDEWDACLDIKSIIGRNYDMFALLFGVRNYGKYIPLAKERGLPSNASEEATKDYEEWGMNAHGSSWITWEEIQNIKWMEKGTELANRVYCYRKGEENWFQSFLWSSELNGEDYEILNRGESFERNGIVYKRNVISMEDAISGDWQCLFDIMKRIDELHKASTRDINTVESVNSPVVYRANPRIRLVVWFDN
jgi:hypothetical protein